MVALTPELLVEDVDSTVAWYQKILGFKVILSTPASRISTFARIKREDIEIMLFRRSEFALEIPDFKSAPVGGSFVLYLELDDISNDWNTIQNQVEVVQSLHTTDYGSQEFTIRDCNGYYLMFGQRN